MDQRIQRQRPSSSPSSQAKRKIFNCVVDDTALVAGVKRSTRNGLRQWIKNSQIRLFVPLHALEQLSLQKSGDSRHAEDVRETLDWLDDATTRYPDSVALQGGDETFEDWSEVERFIVPRSLFSEEDDLASSPEDKKSTIKTMSEHFDRALQVTPNESVPRALQPLFSYLLWRIHQEVDRAAALDSFIFLCNDPAKVELARGFEVRCKRLEQLRDAVGREDKDNKARQGGHRPSHSVSSLPDESPSPPRSPPSGPAAMTAPPQADLYDPDTFGRSPTVASPARGRGRGSMRGRARAVTSPKQGRAELVFSGRERGDIFIESGPEIDPNSFERPRGGHVGRGGRKLWTPG